MADSIAKTFFPELAGKLERQKNSAAASPFTMSDINLLLSVYRGGQPLYSSIAAFYTKEYEEAVAKGLSGEELEVIPRFRTPLPEELNLIYCDIHVRPDKFVYTGSSQSGS